MNFRKVEQITHYFSARTEKTNGSIKRIAKCAIEYEKIQRTKSMDRGRVKKG